MTFEGLVPVLARATERSAPPKPIEMDELLLHDLEWPLLDQGVRSELETALRTIPSVIGAFDGQEQLFLGGGVRIATMGSLAMWLVWRARRVSPESAVADLRRYCEATTLPYHAVLALAHLEVRESVDLAEGVALVPFENVPDCLPKRMLYKDGLHEWRYGPMQVLLPRIALVYSAEVPKDAPEPETAGYDLGVAILGRHLQRCPELGRM